MQALLIDHANTPTLSESEVQRCIDFVAAFLDCDKIIADAQSTTQSGSKTRSYANKLWYGADKMRKELAPRSRI